MNNKKVFGNTLINVPAPELVKNGLIHLLNSMYMTERRKETKKMLVT